MESQPQHSFFTNEIKQFAVKTAIVFFLFIAAVIILLPDTGAMSNSLEKALKNEKTKFLLGGFIQNPVSLYRASEIDEKDGKLDNAVMEMELAIGLIEMHGANQQMLNRYTARLSNLKALSSKNPALP